MVFGGDHGVCARTVGHTQACAQVVGVGHAVQHQEQGRAFHGVEQVVQRVVLRHGRDHRHHALVAVATGQLGQALTVRFDHAHARVSGLVDELAHARIAARDLVMDFNNGLGGDLEANAHGMKAEQHFGRRHPRIIVGRSLPI